MITPFESQPWAQTSPSSSADLKLSSLESHLYWEQPCGREEADSIFKYAMQEFKVSSVHIASIYTGVRAGGEAAWNSNLKLKSLGERRELALCQPEAKVRKRLTELDEAAGFFRATAAHLQVV